MREFNSILNKDERERKAAKDKAKKEAEERKMLEELKKKYERTISV